MQSITMSYSTCFVKKTILTTKKQVKELELKLHLHCVCVFARKWMVLSS